MSPEAEELLAALNRHALEHYEEDGWDYLVETYDKEIGGATTLEEAIAKISPALKVLDERRRDIRAEAF